MSDNLEHLRRLSDAASKGPWERKHAGNMHYGVSGAPYVERGYRPSVVHAHSDSQGYGNGSTEADAVFIAQAVNYVRSLLSATAEEPVVPVAPRDEWASEQMDTESAYENGWYLGWTEGYAAAFSVDLS